MKPSQFSQLFSIILLFLVIVGTVVFVLPMSDKVAALKEDKAAAALELEGIQSEYDALSALAENVAKSAATKQALTDAVPNGYSQDELILELSKMADDLDFDLNAMNFSVSADQEYGNSVTVAANFSGSYDDLINFLRKIEGGDRLMQVTSIAVQLTSTNDIVFNLNIEAYYQ